MHVLKQATWFRAVFLVAIAVLAAGQVRAAELKGVTLPDTITVGEDTSLALRGIGLLKYKIIFNGYVSGLYLPADTKSAQVLEDVPKRLVFHYFWDIEGKAFAPAATPYLEGQFSKEELAAVQSGIDAMSALYVDIEEGDEYSLTYIPGVGTELAKNGTALGTVPGAEFAAVYFAIWLGPKPLNTGLRNTLLDL